MIVQRNGDVKTQGRLSAQEAFQSWLKACQEFEEAKRCEQTVTERPFLLKEAEKRVNIAAETYATTLYSSEARSITQG